MDVFCEICGYCWDARDPGVRYIYADARWECWDEYACFARRLTPGADMIGGYL
jgi:hypothetical protein